METHTILIVDDEQHYLNILTQALKEKGYRILQAKNGKKACEAAEKLVPDIIITDWEMPVMNGFEATRLIRGWEQKMKQLPIPVFAFTASYTKEDMKRCQEAGCDGNISKPLNLRNLRKKIEDLLIIRHPESLLVSRHNTDSTSCR